MRIKFLILGCVCVRRERVFSVEYTRFCDGVVCVVYVGALAVCSVKAFGCEAPVRCIVSCKIYLIFALKPSL